ncbi:STAS domain-containing protein [Hydrogenophaga soli]|nr:STAS domain-containing protein [Burkholderiaceae bacterium]
MSKDTSPAGLFSKVVQFVRHPATSWGDLDTVSEQRDNYSKQALKEMIERKRRNDFVRKREFDMLRKLRAKSGSTDVGQRGRPSFFQSSYSSRPDDRAGTLKKIDEIEAQMSMQWWKTKQRDSSGHTVQNTQAQPSRLPAQETLSTTQAYGTTEPVNEAHAVAPTVPMTLPPHTAEPLEAAKLPLDAPMLAPEAGPTKPPGLSERREDSGFSVSNFSASKFYAMDVAELAMDPEIEEAAIRFASGDQAATEQGLKEVLSRKGVGGTADEWLALLDLYRATGQSEAFETHALDFANRFSRSAPQWFSMPEEAAARVAQVDASTVQTRATWVTEADLDVHLVTMMTKVLERTPPPWVLDWTPLQSIQPAAVVRLARLFSGWAEASMDLRFLGAGQLLQVLGQMTPSGDRSADRAAWDLHLAVLRVMNLAEDFELKALDFCVTYEISPPAWEVPRCQFHDLSAEPLGVVSAAPAEPPVLTDFVQSRRQGLFSGRKAGQQDPMATSSFSFTDYAQGELVGELLGDPSRQLEALDALMTDAMVRVVSCKYLIRVDFSAAGAILNWASGHVAAGRQVRFIDVHRLISAFFHVIGITEHAEVVTRDD